MATPATQTHQAGVEFHNMVNKFVVKKGSAIVLTEKTQTT